MLNARIPTEMLSFFSKPGGHSLIVRGDAGTGKTTLALQSIEELAQYNNSHYYSTRVSDFLLLVQFPWLGVKLYGREYEEYVRTQAPWLMGEGDPKLAHVNPVDGRDHDNGLKNLVDAYRNGVSTIHKDDGASMEDVRKVYDVVKTSLPDRSLIVIDSLDALADKYGLSNAAFINAIQKDLVEGYGANVIFIFENNERALDYLADGVAILSYQEHNSRAVRQIKIQKLRGCEIKQARYLFTLKGGRVQSFGNADPMDVAPTKEWVPLMDQRGKISSGILDLDRLINGGFAPGSVVLLDMGSNIPSEIISVLEQSTIANFASQRRGVIWLPMKQVSAERVRNQMSVAIHPNLFDKCVRIPEQAIQTEPTRSNYIYNVEGSDAGADLKWDSLTYSLKSAETPYLTMLGFDTLESIYGESVMGDLTEHIAAMKRTGGVFMALTSPSTRSTKKLIDLSTIHLKLERIDGVLVLYGEEPYTECNALSLDLRERGGCLSLTPVV
jgi:KaiC/GvpD/RAD55 family RecA-like ATPase